MNARKCFDALTMLLDKYGIAAPKEYGFLCDNIPSFRADSNIIRLLPWRQDRRMVELKRMLFGGYAGEPSVYRATRITEDTKDPEDEIKRELDLCEWIMESPAASVCMVRNGRAANLVVKLESGVVCTLEIAVTLKSGEADINRHEINTRRGVLSDYAVDTQINQQSVYLFGEKEEKYTDIDFELYGLNYYEITAVRSAFVLLRDDLSGEYVQRARYLDRLSAAAGQSDRDRRRIDLQTGKA